MDFGRNGADSTRAIGGAERTEFKFEPWTEGSAAASRFAGDLRHVLVFVKKGLIDPRGLKRVVSGDRGWRGDRAFSA